MNRILSSTWLVIFFILTIPLIIEFHQEIPQPSTTAFQAGAIAAIATVIERFWETMFNLLESLILSFGSIAGLFGTQIRLLVDAAKQTINQTAETTDPDILERLQNINALLADAIKAPQYVAIKKFVTLYGSLLMGVGIAISARISLFHSYGLGMPIKLDILLTGTVIGAGAEPVHQLINSLQSVRDSFSGLAGLLQGNALKQATGALSNAARVQGDGVASLAPVPSQQNPPGDGMVAQLQQKPVTNVLARSEALIRRNR